MPVVPLVSFCSLSECDTPAQSNALIEPNLRIDISQYSVVIVSHLHFLIGNIEVLQKRQKVLRLRSLHH